MDFIKPYLKDAAPYGLILIIAFVPLFVNLGAYPIQLWDESRMATSAYEMTKSNQLLIPTFQGRSELWSIKPPLLIWLQYAAMECFGVNEFSVRLPSALAGLAIFLVISFWVKKIGYSFLTSLFIVLLIIGSNGFMGWHCLRTGDYEGLMTLFMVAQSLFFFLYLASKDLKKQHTYLTICLISTVLGVLTKGVNSLFMTPIFVLWWLVEKKWKQRRHGLFIIKVAATIIACLAYYIIREWAEPGYIQLVKLNELSGRFLNSLENHKGGYDFYWKLFPEQTGAWIYGFVPITVLALAVGHPKRSKPILYLASCALIYYLVIQMAQTKNTWYSAPLIPFTALIFALSIESLIERISEKWRTPKFYRLAALCLVVFVASAEQYAQKVQSIWRQTRFVEHTNQYYEVTNFLRDQLESPTMHGWIFIDFEYSAHNWWYIDRLKDKGHDMKFFIHLDSIAIGDTLVLNQRLVYDSLKGLYQIKELSPSPDFHVIQLSARE